MRFRQLRGLTNLPIEPIRGAFREEDVRTVLPTSDESHGQDALLVATPSALAIVTGESGPRGPRWLTRWAPWEIVQIGRMTVVDAERSHLVVTVGPMRFVTSLPGELGRQALHDFITAAPARATAPTS